MRVDKITVLCAYDPMTYAVVSIIFVSYFFGHGLKPSQVNMSDALTFAIDRDVKNLSFTLGSHLDLWTTSRLKC